MSGVYAVMIIAQRDLLRFLRDYPRIAATLGFPLIFIAALGGTMQASFGDRVGYNFITFVFTGVYAQTLFQSAAFGIISLIEDRDNDFSQEMFVSPISRYAIIFGKILGETLVAMAQGAVIVLFGALLGVPMTALGLLSLIPTGIAACFLGGAFGVTIMAGLGSRRAIEQAFNFVMLPQFFLGGVFTPLKELPIYLDVLSRITPLRYAVDFVRGLFYVDNLDYAKVVLDSPLVNLLALAASFLFYLVLGTAMFVRAERNR